MSESVLIAITTIISSLTLMVMHLLRIAFFKNMPDWVRHVLGVLGLALPASFLFAYWHSWRELIALWSVIVFGGGGLLIAFVIESWWDERTRRIQAEQVNDVVINQLKSAGNEQGK